MIRGLIVITLCIVAQVATAGDTWWQVECELRSPSQSVTSGNLSFGSIHFRKLPVSAPDGTSQHRTIGLAPDLISINYDGKDFAMLWSDIAKVIARPSFANPDPLDLRIRFVRNNKEIDFGGIERRCWGDIVREMDAHGLGGKVEGPRFVLPPLSKPNG